MLRAAAGTVSAGVRPRSWHLVVPMLALVAACTTSASEGPLVKNAERTITVVGSVGADTLSPDATSYGMIVRSEDGETEVLSVVAGTGLRRCPSLEHDGTTPSLVIELHDVRVAAAEYSVCVDGVADACTPPFARARWIAVDGDDLGYSAIKGNVRLDNAPTSQAKGSFELEFQVTDPESLVVDSASVTGSFDTALECLP